MVVASSRLLFQMRNESYSVSEVDLAALARASLRSCFDWVVGLVVCVVYSPLCLRAAQMSAVIADVVVSWFWSW